MTKFSLTYGDQRIPYDVQPDDRRSTKIAIHVNPNGAVSVDAPPGYADQDIRNAVQKRARWVTTHVAQARERHAHVRPREYVSGEQVLYIGRRYVLKVIKTGGKPGPVRLRGNRLEVETKVGTSEEIRGHIRGWYRVKARDYFARRLADLSMRLPWTDRPPPFRLMEMTRQWGSCSPSGEILVNPNLIKAPRDGIEYVLLHELVHLKHHDHGPDFWKLIDQYAPEWRRAKHHLDVLVEVLLAD